jgi:anti-sigma28 factor (negative regulator of flagellin synthesis)
VIKGLDMIAVAAKELSVLETYRDISRSSTDRHASAGRPGDERHRSEDRPAAPARPGASVGPRDAAADRAARIAEIRRQIAEGTYETDGKLDRAVNGLLSDLGS